MKFCESCGENTEEIFYTCPDCGNVICDVCSVICKKCREHFCDACYLDHKVKCN